MAKTKRKPSRSMTPEQRRQAELRRAALRAVGPRTFQRIVTRSHDVSIAEQIRRHEAAQESLERLQRGTAYPGDFDAINELVQLTGACCAYIEDQQDAEDGIETVNRAARTMKAMRTRYLERGSLLFDGAGLEHVRVVIDMYGQFLEQISNSQLATAEKWVAGRLELARRGGAA